MKKLKLIIPSELDRKRLDVVLATLLPEYSRSQLSQWIKQGFVSVLGVVPDKINPKYAVHSEQHVEVCMPHIPQTQNVSQVIDLSIVHEDESIIIINKPAGLTVHPGAGQPHHTLLNGLLYLDDCFARLPRAGIVHRLDKLTSGLMVVAKNLPAHTSLVRQLQHRTISRRYLALVNHVPITHFYCTMAIGRHPTVRTKMGVLEHGGKSARTDFSIIKKYRRHAFLEATLSTGRTHQIRVHLSAMGYPIVGDSLYGRRVVLSQHLSYDTMDKLQKLRRQALHAHYLRLRHPTNGEWIAFHCPLPPDLQQIIDGLESDNEP